MKNTLVFFTGVSGTGKTSFVDKVLPIDSVYNLKSATTRVPRENEMNGRDYYFRDEKYFDEGLFATKLWVNEALWEPGKERWMYGVPEFEIFDHIGQDLGYAVIQPAYIKQMQDWFHEKKLDRIYDFKIIWFQPMGNTADIVKKRQNMPDDVKVRKMNTCNLEDFKRAGLSYDFIVRFNQTNGAYYVVAKNGNKILPNLAMDELLRKYGKRNHTITVFENFAMSRTR